MNFWKLFIAAVTLGAVATSSEKDKDVVGPLRQDNGGETPLLPEQKSSFVPDLNSTAPALTSGDRAVATRDLALVKRRLRALASRVPEGRALNAAGVPCRPVILVTIDDGSNTQGRLDIVKQGTVSSLTQVNPVFAIGILFGNIARTLFIGSSVSSEDEVAIVNNLTPTTTGTGPGTNLKAALDLALVDLKNSEAQIRALIKAGIPVVVEIISDFVNTVNTVPNNPTASEAAIIASYDALEGYIKYLIQDEKPVVSGGYEIISFAVPGLSGKNLPLAERISTLAIDYPQAVDLVNDPNVSITKVNEGFCAAPPVQTAVPSAQPVQRTEAPTQEPTESTPPPFNPLIPAAGVAAAGGFAIMARGITRKQYKFVPNPAFEAAVKKRMQEILAGHAAEDVEYQRKLEKYNNDLTEYNKWLKTPETPNNVNAVPSKKTPLTKPLNRDLHTERGISPFTTNFPPNIQGADPQGKRQERNKPVPPIKRPRPTEDQIIRTLVEDPNMPPALILEVLLGGKYASGLFSPVYIFSSTFKKGIGPEVEAINPPEAQPKEASAQKKTSWQKFKYVVWHSIFGELRNENAGKFFTSAKEKTPMFIRKPVNAVSVVVRSTVQLTYGVVIAVFIYAPIRFFTYKIEFAGLGRNGRRRPLTRQDLEEIKKMPGLTEEQKEYIDKINPDELPVAKAGYQILWENLQSLLKKGSGGSATIPVPPPASQSGPVVPPSTPDPVVFNPVFGREIRAATGSPPPPPSPIAASDGKPTLPPGKPKPPLGSHSNRGANV